MRQQMSPLSHEKGQLPKEQSSAHCSMAACAPLDVFEGDVTSPKVCETAMETLQHQLGFT